MRKSGLTLAVIATCLLALTAEAHVSERALVLLLPTDVYIVFGVGAVLATVFLVVLVPANMVRAAFKLNAPPTDVAQAPTISIGQGLVSFASFLCFAGLVAAGFLGSRDPLSNLLPLMFFTGWWICFPFLQALFGDIWSWLNPWSGPVALVFRGRSLGQLPTRFGVWPALVTYLLAGIYTLTDIAPDDPARLAYVAGGYWLFTFAMCALFGRDWLHRGEGFTVFFDLLARLSPIIWRPFGGQFPGRLVVVAAHVPVSVAVFSITLLAIGSFDGLNETFWWMGKIGVNPLAFPGRSAVVWPNRIGLLAAVVLLNAAFAICVWLGLALIGQRAAFWRLYGALSLTILPIALGYHFAHYLTSALVGLQYLAISLNDPFGTGAAWLGLQDYYVTTSFFNQHHLVQRIWLTQAGAIVLAHILAVILSHAIALRAFGSHMLAVISQLPVAAFMVAYTFFGLWLLASPVAL